MRQINGIIAQVLYALGAVWTFALAFHVLVDVVGRALNVSVPGTVEVARESIICIVFLQVAYCVQTRGMLRVDFFVGYFNNVAGRIVASFGYVLGFVFFGVVALGAAEPAWRAWSLAETEGDGAFRMPTWPARWSIVAGSSLAALSYLTLIFDEWRTASKPSDTADPTNALPPSATAA